MLTSAPFDNWWHNAYGLDVKIVSPPHALLILGLRGISTGIMFLILAAMNRAAQAETGAFKRLQLLFLYVGGLAVVGQMFFLQEYTWDIKLHGAIAYIAMGIGIPLFFATFSQASRARWAATSTAAVYTFFIIAEILILPLFPAQPKLGPVFNPVTHMIPAKFPVLILVPALALDLLWQRVKNWKLWQIALVSGVLFIAVLTAVEWPFANFLLSHASENRFFGTIYFGYDARATGADRMREWFYPDHGAALYLGLLRAAIYASISTWIGLVFGSLDAWCAAMRLARGQTLFAFLLSLAFTLPAHAHIGSKDVYEEVNAGPYKLFVTIRTPNVIPGVATIEVRSSGPAVSSMRVTPTPLTGEAAKHPPSSDAMQSSVADPAFFTGSLWLMATGSWQVHFDLDGAAGKASTSVPVPAIALSILPMQRPLGITLALLGMVLVIGIAGIVAAAVGQSRLDPGLTPAPKQRRRAMIASDLTPGLHRPDHLRRLQMVACRSQGFCRGHLPPA